MSSWVVRRTRPPLPSSRCAECRSASASTGKSRFHVNDVNDVNDPGPVASRLLDPLLARLDRVGLTRKGAWRLNTPSAWLEQAWPVHLEVVFDDLVPVRTQWLAQGPGLNGNRVWRRMTCDIRLRRPVSAAFAYTATARAHQRGRRRRG
ncbi:hypothetical protein J5X84_26900 [Streptosporangiaceae bacterium NEAU-GS5]|nr:hypothetical protein [Streptosporangiaceae bacterium NEAU-GS5]